MSLPQKKLIPSILVSLVIGAIAGPPLWWSSSSPPVIDTAAVENNHGPANIGQAKHMTSSALVALEAILPEVAQQIEQDLTIPQPNPEGGNFPAILELTVPDPKPANWAEMQKAPLLIGQLKAISDPFYERLNSVVPDWLETERNTNGTSHLGSIFPWTSETLDDENSAIATIGQLKAVFSLRFDTLPANDSDADGLPDAWETQYFSGFQQGGNDDPDDDGLTNAEEFNIGTNPTTVEVDINGNGIPDAWEAYRDSEIAGFPSRFKFDLNWGNLETRSLYLNNSTPTAANYSISLSGETVAGYSWEDSQTGTIAYAWTDISSTGTALSTIANNDNDSEKITLSQFTFPYYGRDQSEVWVCTNGYLNFKREYNDSSNDELPDYSSPFGAIAAFWDDLDTGVGGDIYFKEEATRLIVQYEAVAKDDGSGANTFQIILNADGSLEFHYKQMDGDLDECSVGIQNVSRNQGILLRYNADAASQISLQNRYAIRFNPTNTLFTLAPLSGSAANGVATQLTATFEAANIIPGTYTGSIDITHDGTGTSQWNVPFEVRLPYAKITDPNFGYTLWQGESLSSTGAYLRSKVVDTPDDIDRVEFRFGDKVIGTDTTASNDEYSYDWSNVPPGEHQVYARVILANGQTDDSVPILIDVTPDADGDHIDDRWEQTHFGGLQENPLDDFDGDGASNLHEYDADRDPTDASDTPTNIPSALVVTDPIDAFTVLEGERIYLRSTVADSDFGVEYVDFLADGVVVVTDTSVTTIASRYWTTAPAGTHFLTARATDRYGAVSTSSAVTITVLPDADRDGITDSWETANGLDPNDPADARLDTDQDGYTNLEEYTFGKDPNLAEDADNDGIPDGWEYHNGTQILVADASHDPDADGLTNSAEYTAGTDPFDSDTDDDDFSDGDELFRAEGATDPTSPDSDSDGIPDGWEASNGLDPLVDDAALDPDADTLDNLAEFEAGTDPNSADTDSDGMTDAFEVAHDLNPNIDDSQLDADSDGLSNFDEYLLQTNPRNADTDGDLLPDGAEVAYPTLYDPLVANPEARLTDTDLDGYSDFFELLAGTSPSDTADNPGNAGGDSPPGPGVPLPPATNPPAPPQPPPALPAADWKIEIEPITANLAKHGYPEFRAKGAAPPAIPKHYLKMLESVHFDLKGGDEEQPESRINGSRQNTVDPLTGGVATNDKQHPGNDNMGGNPSFISPTLASITTQETRYDDEPNGKPDQDSDRTYTQTLASENATENLLTNTKSQLEAYQDTFTEGTPLAYRDLSADQTHFSYGKVQFRIKWPEEVPEESRYTVTFLLVFEPEDDPNTEENESKTQVEVLRSIQLDTQFTVQEIDPDTERSGEDGRYYLLPVDIDDNTFATGIDDVSITSTSPEVRGYQDNFWIMAPCGGQEYNGMRFKIPFDPGIKLKIETSNATPDPQNIILGTAVPGPVVTWKGLGSSSLDHTPVWKIGEAEQPAELPISVKNMKYRTVTVAVFPVRDPQSGRAVVPLPPESVLQAKMDETFGVQLNAWISLDYRPQQDYDYDPDGDGYALTEDNPSLWQMRDQPSFSAPLADIRLFVIDNVHVLARQENVDNDNGSEIYGSSNRATATVFANAGNPTEGVRSPQDIVDTIAHEIGHIFVGSGHPNDYNLELEATEEGFNLPPNFSGPAPLPGTDMTVRLMSSPDDRAPGARFLVKTEWDEAEDWLHANVDN